MNLDQDTARANFAAARVARFATADAAGQPHLVPVTYAVDGDRVFFAVDSKPKRSADLKRLRNIAENPAVALLADEYDDDWSRLWWVRADGTARIVTDEKEFARVLELLQERYPQYRADVPDGPIVEIVVSRWSGWTFANGAKLPA
jgi:PPOX class probable F420-dependent enzyme